MRTDRFRRWTRAAGLLSAIAAAGCVVPTIAFYSSRNVDGTDSAGKTDNIWRIFYDGTGLFALTNSTVDKAYSVYPRYSPDGSKIVYASAQKLDGSGAAGAAVNIWWLSPSVPNHPTPLTTATAAGADSTGPLWSPDGTKIAFTSQRKLDGSDAATPVPNVWKMNADGTGLTPITNLTAQGGSCELPVWSPDGTKIAFQSRRLPDGSDAIGAPFNIWWVNADGTGLAPITTATAQGTDSQNPQWSPDGKRVVFNSQRRLDGGNFAGTTSNIWVANADGTGLTPITKATDAQATSRNAQWSTDGTRIVFESMRNPDGSDSAVPTSNVWVVNPDGTGLKALTTAKATGDLYLAPVWFPDGSKVAFHSVRKLDGSDARIEASTWNIWSVKSDGTGLAPITKTASAGTNSFNPNVH